MDRWITDTPTSKRFPIYTWGNADEVGPEPFSPLRTPPRHVGEHSLTAWFSVKQSSGVTIRTSTLGRFAE